MMRNSVRKEIGNIYAGGRRIGSLDSLIVSALCFFLFFAVATLTFAYDGKGPRAGRLPLDNSGRMQISQADRCPVCGMKVIRYPKFACAIRLHDNTTYYFCSTGCMIRSWLHPEIYLGSTTDTLNRPVVKEYFTGRQMDARDTIFVFGSDVIGPMGPALVPVMNEKSLKAFKRRHGGKSEFSLKNLTDAKWFEMTGKKLVK